MKQTNRRQFLQGKLIEGSLNKVDSKKRENVQAITQAIMHAAIEYIKAAVQAVSQATSPTENSVVVFCMKCKHQKQWTSLEATNI